MPPQADAAFVAKLEDVVRVYARPPDPARPLVCFDEAGKELRREVRPPRPPAPGHPARHDSEYAREGSANLFLWVAPHLGQRQITVTTQRTAIDWAHAMRDLVDAAFPEAARIVLVQDNLNTHDPASLYKAFPPAEAARIWSRLELHFTPTHGSWLNMAELELSALARQCLARRLPDQPTLQQEVTAWAEDRNRAAVGIDWRFSVEDARSTLTHLYPVPEVVT
ncbi:MAG TPA: IS630 family transposase [Pseudonocardiaceae bacterium]|nr:IS630 family transposase [Pseudonocardiaceae bacterium]